MIIKSLIILVFIAIIYNLAKALFHIVGNRSEDDSAKTAKALTYRISLSLALFIFLFIAVAFGLLKPHGIGAKIQDRNANHSLKN